MDLNYFNMIYLTLEVSAMKTISVLLLVHHCLMTSSIEEIILQDIAILKRYIQKCKCFLCTIWVMISAMGWTRQLHPRLTLLDGKLLWQCPYNYVFMIHQPIPVLRKHSLIFSWNSETKASLFINKIFEMYPRYYMHRDIFSNLQSLSTQ